MAGKLEGFSPEQTQEMWGKPGVEGWFDFLQEKAPNRQWENHGSTLKGLCPWHQDSNPSLEFKPENQSARCYVCNKYTRDLLPFLAEVTHTAVDELYYELAQRFKFKTSPEVESQLRYETVIASLKGEFVRICTNALNEAANGHPDYRYGTDAVDYLKSRNLDLQYLFEYGIGIFPTKRQAFDQMPVHLRSDFESYFGAWFNPNPDVTGQYGGHIVMPFYTTTSRVGRIKLRPPSRERHPIWIGGEKTEQRGFFGLNMFRTILGSNAGAHSGRCIVVEGEMDQLSFHQEQLRHHGGDLVPIVAGSGGSAEDIGMLKRSGVKHVTLMGDFDKGGVSFVKKILGEASQDKLHRISIFDWGHRYPPGTDPDDVVQRGGYQQLRAELLDPAFLQEPHEWATERVKDDYLTMTDNTTRARVELAQKYSEVLKSEIDFDAFQQSSALVLGLKPSLLEKHTTDIESPEGFIRAIEKALNQLFRPLVLKRTHVTLYRIREERPQTIPFSPTRAWKSTIEGCLGRTIYDWVEDNVGIPDHVALRMTKTGPEPVPMEVRMNKIDQYFDWAFDRLKAQCHLEDELETKRQGYHFIAEDHPIADLDLPDGEPLQRHYVVNGNQIFIGHEVDGQLRWTQSKSPIHGGFYFETLATERWSKYITIPNLEDAVLEAPEDMYHLIRDPIASGFRFKEGDIHAQGLAYYIMGASALTAYKSMTQLFFTATSRSGKSTMMLGILSQRKYPEISMLEMSDGSDDYTSAYVMQKGGGSSLIMCLDEFEDPAYAKSSKRHHFDALLTSFRNMDTGAVRGRGTPAQQAKEVKARFPIICAGIHPFQNAVDSNRFITIEMDHTPGHVAPDVALTQKYGLAYFEKIRRWTTLFPLRHVLQLQELYAELEVEIIESGKVSYVNSRSARLIIPLCVIAKLCGHDYLAFANQYIALLEKRLDASAVSEEEALFRAVMQTNAITIEMNPARRSVIKILANELDRMHLKDADMGVYWVPQTDVIILYPSKLATLLRFSPEFKMMSNTNQIHQILARHKHVHSDEAFFMQNGHVLRYLRQFIANPRTEELLYVKLEDLAFSQNPPEDFLAGLDDM